MAVLGHRVQQLAQAGVLQCELAGRALPLEQALVLLAQLGILGPQRDQLADVLGQAARGVDRLHRDLENRRQEIADAAVDGLEQPDVGLADDQKDDRDDDQGAEGKAIGQRLQRHGQT